jgi:hypothetical protein
MHMFILPILLSFVISLPANSEAQSAALDKLANDIANKATGGASFIDTGAGLVGAGLGVFKTGTDIAGAALKTGIKLVEKFVPEPIQALAQTGLGLAKTATAIGGKIIETGIKLVPEPILGLAKTGLTIASAVTGPIGAAVIDVVEAIVPEPIRVIAETVLDAVVPQPIQDFFAGLFGL